MSELIDRLRAASGAAGSAAADNLAATETVDVMATRIRSGVRRRRVTTAIAGGVAAVALGVTAVVTPRLLDAPAPSLGPAGRTVLHTDGALTVYDDGSLSVVTTNGRIVDVSPVPGAPVGLEPRTKAEECHFVPGEVELGWTWQRDDYAQRLVTFGSANLVDGEQWSVIQQGQEIPAKYDRSLGFEVVVDPAIADSIVVQHTVVDLYEGLPVSVGTVLTAAPEVVLSAEGAAASDAAAVLHSSKLDAHVAGDCGRKIEPPISAETIRIDTYVIADVWLTDRAGTAVLLGTHVTRGYSELEVTE